MQKILNASILVVVFVTFINGLFFFYFGIKVSVQTYLGVIQNNVEHPGVHIVEALDLILIGFVFIIFSVGLSKLFLTDYSFLKGYELPWLQLKDFNQLKTLLISAILVALFVAWIPEAPIFQTGVEVFDWTEFIFPLSLLIMAAAARLIKELH